MKRKLIYVGRKMIIAIFMTLAGGILIGAILLKTLLLYPVPDGTSEPGGISLVRE